MYLLLLTFSLDENFLGQSCLWTFSASCLQDMRLINDGLYCQIVEFCCQFCNAARESALHVSFTLMHVGLEMFSSLCFLTFLKRFVFAICTLFCSLTDWKCLLFAKKWNLSDTWSLNRIHFILLFLFADNFQISRPTCLPLGNVNVCFCHCFAAWRLSSEKYLKYLMVFFHSVVYIHTFLFFWEMTVDMLVVAAASAYHTNSPYLI